VDLLVELNADITAPLANGATPMLVACERSHTDVVHRLMQLNIEPPMLPAGTDRAENTEKTSNDSDLANEESTTPADYLGQCRLDVQAEPKPTVGSGVREWAGVSGWLSGAIAAVTPAKARADGSSPQAWAGIWSAGDILSKVTGSGGLRRNSSDDEENSFCSSSGSEGDPDSLEVV
jgi:hypothetical protein